MKYLASMLGFLLLAQGAQAGTTISVLPYGEDSPEAAEKVCVLRQKGTVPTDEPETLNLCTPDGKAVLRFAETENSFGVAGISFGDAQFALPMDAQSNGLWRLSFKAGPNGEEKMLDAARARLTRSAKTERGIRIFWEGLDLEPGDRAVDVIAEIGCNECEGRFEFRIRVNNRSDRFGLYNTEYPRLSSVVRPSEGWAVYPNGNWGGLRVRKMAEGRRDLYPGFEMPMQLATFDSDKGCGLMVSALDYEARLKYFNLGADFSFTFETPAEDAGVAGAAGAPPFAVALTPYRGDWWKAAKLYRRWALGAPWMTKGPIAKRRDFHQRMRDCGLWMCLSSSKAGNMPDGTSTGFSSVEVVEGQIEKTLELLKGRVPLSVHWYCWHPFEHDVGYPAFLPPREGFPAALKRLQAKGVQIMPYINARIVDEAGKFAADNVAAQIKEPDGTPRREHYCGETYQRAMCQSTRTWRDCITDVVDGLANGLGAKCIYIDQISSMRPCLCFDRSHDHPVGGGKWWTEGYRMLVEACQSRAPQTALTSESSAEPYIDLFDGFLTWCPSKPEDVPLMAAVYSGYQNCFACSAKASYDLTAFRATEGRAFMFGVNVGWLNQWVLADDKRDHFEYLVKLCEAHRANLDLFCDGELLGEVKNELPTEILDLDWIWWIYPVKARLPAVEAYRWRAPDGREAVAVCNYDSKAHDFAGGGISRVTLEPGAVRVLTVKEAK